jgi:indole-3-glycerol phosphate synthase
MSALREIFEHKRGEVERARQQAPISSMEGRASDQEPPRGFINALKSAPGTALIAEIKAASPSRGEIRPGLDPKAVAEQFEEAGAHALSVLTDARYFKGSLDNLVKARDASRLPALRKDFLFDPYQVVESRAFGADAILLIVAALSRSQLDELMDCARQWGMNALVEVHNEREADIAIESGATLIGVNNRDLSTFQTDLEVSDRILPRIAPHALAVSESAIEANADVKRVAAAGAKAVLIGTTFCEAPDIGARVREVMGWE